MSTDDYPGDSSTTGRLELNTPLEAVFEHCPIDGEEYDIDSDAFHISLNGYRSYEVFAVNNNGLIQATIGTRDRDDIRQEFFYSIGGDSFSRSVYSVSRPGDFLVQASNIIGSIQSTYTIEVRDYEIPEAVTTDIFLGQDIVRRNTIETEFDRDFFRTQLRKNWTYQFELRGVDSGRGSLVDPYLRIYDSSAHLLKQKNDGGAGRDTRLVFVPPDDGDYFVSTSGFIEHTGTYELDYSLLDYFDDAATGPQTLSNFVIPANQRVAMHGELEVGSDIDWHKINLVAGRWYQFGWESGPSNAILFVRDTANQVKLIANDGRFRADKSGIHHLVVRASNNIPRQYRIFGVDNSPPVIARRGNSFDLVGDQMIALPAMFSLNGFSASSIQVYSEADFYVGTEVHEAFELHTIPGEKFAEVTFAAERKRGEYDVSIRAQADGAWTGWASAFVSSEVSSEAYLSSGASWNESNTSKGSDNIITFRFADTAPSYFDSTRFTAVEKVSVSVQGIFEDLFSSRASESYSPRIGDLADLRFEYNDTESADIQIFAAETSDLAVGHRPGLHGFGDIILDREFYAGTANPEPGSYEYFSILKAVGAALGNKFYAPELSRDESVAGSFNLESGNQPYSESFGYWDVEHLRQLYGESTVDDPIVWGRADYFEFNPANQGSFTRTINRTTQGNRISAEYASRPATIDLRERERSHLNGDGPWQSYTIGKGQFVHRAIGSEHNDQLIGNHGDNRIEGLDGDDQLIGLGGSDLVFGGTGNDTYFYETGDGNDVLQDSGESRAAGGIDTLRLTAKFGMNSVADDLTFRKNGDDLVIDLDMNGQFNRNNGEITIRHMSYEPWQIERLDLRNFSQQLGVISLVSVWQNISEFKQRFSVTGESDQFGLIATPI